MILGKACSRTMRLKHLSKTAAIDESPAANRTVKMSVCCSSVQRDRDECLVKDDPMGPFWLLCHMHEARIRQRLVWDVASSLRMKLR